MSNSAEALRKALNAAVIRIGALNKTDQIVEVLNIADQNAVISPKDAQVKDIIARCADLGSIDAVAWLIVVSDDRKYHERAIVALANRCDVVVDGSATVEDVVRAIDPATGYQIYGNRRP